MGVDFGAVFCGLWGWISRLCFTACGGGFRGLWGWISQLWGWPVGVDFSAVVFVLEPGFEVICFVFEILLN